MVVFCLCYNCLKLFVCLLFLFLMVFGTTSWAQFDDVYSSSPWDYEEGEAESYTSSDDSYNASVHDATIYSDIDFYNDEYWMYDDYDFRYSRNINRFYQPIYGTTYYDFRYTNGFYYCVSMFQFVRTKTVQLSLNCDSIIHSLG